MKLLSLFFLLAGVALAVDLLGYVHWNDVCPNYEALGATKVLLDSGRYSARVTRSGNFSMFVLLLSFGLRVDVFDTPSLPEIKSHVFGSPLLSSAAVSLPYPISLTARSKNNYFKPHESFNLFRMFQNPMMMLTLVVGVMMLAMPYVMKNLDPETLEEMKTQQAKVANMRSSIQSGDIKSGLNALVATEEPKSSTSVAKSQASGGSTVQQRKAGKGGKRR
ncbi:hypothetical protein ID866_2340 [Astraeus odoratus]|nr:hypothetical protein ID866_2340 [Astraeus odoratus]